jgi:hypothetical protein
MSWLDGELPPDRAVRAAEHVAACRDCQELAADLRNVSARMVEWQIEVPPMTAPAGKPPLSQSHKVRFGRSFIGWAASGLAAAVMLAAFLYQSISSRVQISQLGAPQTWSFNEAPARRALPASTGAAGGQQAAPAGHSGPLVAHTARIALTANNFDRARTSLQEIVTRHHGYIADMTVNAEASSGRTIDAALKVPDAQLDAAMQDIKALGRVQSEARGGEEVTQQSLDLDARLVNARNTEERLTDLLKHRTDKLSDILAVENQISETREQIERMEAERKSLNNRIDYAKLDVRITEEYKTPIDGDRTSMSTQLRNAAVEGYANVKGALLGIVVFLLSSGPVLLFWCAALFYPARWAWRRLKRG